MRRKFGSRNVTAQVFLWGACYFQGRPVVPRHPIRQLAEKVPEPSKPSAPISIAYTVPAKASVGEPVEVTIKFQHPF